MSVKLQYSLLTASLTWFKTPAASSPAASGRFRVEHIARSSRRPGLLSGMLAPRPHWAIWAAWSSELRNTAGRGNRRLIFGRVVGMCWTAGETTHREAWGDPGLWAAGPWESPRRALGWGSAAPSGGHSSPPGGCLHRLQGEKQSCTSQGVKLALFI